MNQRWELLCGEDHDHCEEQRKHGSQDRALRRRWLRRARRALGAVRKLQRDAVVVRLIVLLRESTPAMHTTRSA